MMKRRDTPLIEAALTSWRPRTPEGRILPHPAWADLDDAARRELFERTLEERAREAALDDRGLSTAVHLLLRRIKGTDRG